VFGIEEDFGRARVYNQFGNPELIQTAIESWYVYDYEHYYAFVVLIF